MELAHNRRPVLIVAILSSFVTPFVSTAVNIALPAISREFSVDAVLIGWIPTSFIMASAIFLVPFGRVGDIYGRKKIFTAGIAVFGVGSVLCAFAPTVPLLIAYRILQGVGGAMIFGTGMAMLTSVYPQQERGRVLGINVAAVYIGLSIGPFIGGLLTEHFGWRGIFLVVVPLCLFVLAFIWRIEGEWRGAHGEKFDFIGMMIYNLAVVGLMFGLSILPDSLGIVLIMAGIVAIAVFIFWEQRVEHPVMNIALFRGNTVFTFSNLAALINYSATAAVGFLVSLYLQYGKGLSPREAGIILVSQPIIMAALSPVAGRLSDRIEPRILSSLGMGITSLGLFLFQFLSEGTPIAFIVGSLVVIGLGFTLFSSPNTNAIMSSVEKRFYGVASATLGTMRLSGNMLSMGITMFMFSLFIGRVKITHEVVGPFLTSTKVLFAIYSALCLVGVFASLARGRMHK